MDLRQLKIWKRESKSEAVLRSPSSDSGYSDIPGVASSKLLTTNTGRLRLQKKSPLPQAIPSSVANHPQPGKTAKSGTEGKGRGTACLNHPDFSPDQMKDVEMEKLLGFVKAGNLAGIQSILAADKCDVNGKDSLGRSVLHHAVLHGIATNNLTTAQQLIFYGADVNAKDETPNRDTVLHMAIRLGHMEAVQLILQAPGFDIVRCDSMQRQQMLPERFLIDDIYKSSQLDSDATLKKRRSYSDQSALSIRHNILACVKEHFSPVGSETIRDLFVLQDEGLHHFDEVLARLDVMTLRSLNVVDSCFCFDESRLLGNFQLRVLVLSHARLRRLPRSIFEIFSLEVLKIDHNNLEEVPDDVGNLSNLRTLCCDSQRPRLRTLPNSITRLDQLQVLSFCDNRIETMAFVATLPNLRVLRCSANHIARLPTQIVNLSQLTWLDVSHNRISRIPVSLLDLVRRLYRFDYFNLHLQPSHIRRSKAALLAHLELEGFLANASSRKVCANDLTMVVFGETGAGKTTLIQALKDNKGVARYESKHRYPVRIHQFDLTVRSGTDSSPRSVSGTPCSDASKGGFSMDECIGADASSRFVTCLVFGGDHLDAFTRSVRADIYLLLIDLTSLEHHNGSQHLVARHIARLQMWLQALYELSPDVQVLIVGTHADLAKSVTFYDVCTTLDGLMAKARQGHRVRYADTRCHNCLLCCERSMGGRQALTKSRSGHFGFADLSSAHTSRTPSISGHASLSPPDDHHPRSPDSPSLSFPHVVGYYEVDSRRCYPKDSKKSNFSIEQLKSAILRMTMSREGIPVEWIAFSRQLQATSAAAANPSQRISCMSLEDVVSTARSFDISQSQVPLMLQHLHRRGQLIYFAAEDSLLLQLVIIDPAWLLDVAERLLAAQDRSRADGSQILQWLKAEDVDRQFQKGVSTRFSLPHWLLAALEKLEYCAPLSLSPTGERVFFFPRLLELGPPSLDVWPDIPELDERQVAFDVGIRTVTTRMFMEFLMAVNLEGRKTLEIVPDPAPVFLSHCVVFFSALDVGRCDDCQGLRNYTRMQRGVCKTQDDSSSIAHDDVLHKVFIGLQPGMDTVRVKVRGTSPCCIMKMALWFLEQFLDDHGGEVIDPLLLLEKHSRRSCSYSCSSADYSLSAANGSPNSVEFCEDRNFSLLCPKCVLLRDVHPERISHQFMTTRNKAVCNKWHNLGSWARAVTGDYRFSSLDRPLSLTPTTLPEYEHPRLALLLPPSYDVSLKEWYLTSRMRFLEGFEVHFLCENPTYWHLMDSFGLRLLCHSHSASSSSFCRKDAIAGITNALFGLALPMIQLFQGVNEHSQSGRLLAPVVLELMQMYDYLRCVDPQTQDDAYSWLARNKDRLVAMLTKVLANAVVNFTDGPQQTDVYVKAGASMSPDDILQTPSKANRYELGRFLRLETSSGRFGPLRPLYVGREIRWVCDTHYEELRSMCSLQFNT